MGMAHKFVLDEMLGVGDIVFDQFGKLDGLAANIIQFIDKNTFTTLRAGLQRKPYRSWYTDDIRSVVHGLGDELEVPEGCAREPVMWESGVFIMCVRKGMFMYGCKASHAKGALDRLRI